LLELVVPWLVATYLFGLVALAAVMASRAL
jgi:hypothetical protein